MRQSSQYIVFYFLGLVCIIMIRGLNFWGIEVLLTDSHDVFFLELISLLSALN